MFMHQNFNLILQTDKTSSGTYNVQIKSKHNIFVHD